MKNMWNEPKEEAKIDEPTYGQMLQNLKEMDEELTEMNIEFGELLSLIKHKKLYEYSGHKYWNDFLKDFGIPISEAETYVKVYDLFPPKARFMVPFRRLKKMLRCFDEDLIEKAIALPYYEFIDEVNMKKGRKSKTECDHESYEVYSKCKKCGSWHHIKNEEENKNTINQVSGQTVESLCSI